MKRSGAQTQKGREGQVKWEDEREPQTRPFRNRGDYLDFGDDYDNRDEDFMPYSRRKYTPQLDNNLASIKLKIPEFDQICT